ncbi:hypothetical protein CPC08DRAFT_30681 [Agrocybe pediades]|nr:hypothetical protein CPC08DRAFT_30681 [Agrocybe pediades]
MPKADKGEKEETLAALTARVFAAMLDELIMDATLQSHQEVLRGRTVCPVCNTKCGSVHVPGSSSSTSNELQRRADTPSSVNSFEGAGKGQVNGTAASTPTSLKGEGQLLECVSCQRMLAPNRYAPHLSSCMGLSTARRGAVRGSVKPKQPSEAGRSVSPVSDAGNISEERPIANMKGKAKGKGKKAEETDFGLKRKRLGSPQLTPVKKSKKAKTTGSPVSRVKAAPDISGIPPNSHYSPSTASQAKIPSKLQQSASFIEQSSSSSRESSPAYVATPASSFASTSPVRPVNGTGKPGRGRPLAMGTGPPRRPSPPRVPAIHVPDYHVGEFA